MMVLIITIKANPQSIENMTYEILNPSIFLERIPKAKKERITYPLE